MLTGFSRLKEVKSTIREDEKQKAVPNEGQQKLAILKEALIGILTENSSRITIEDYPYRADFELPAGLDLQALKNALDNNKLRYTDSSVLDAVILVDRFELLALSEKPSNQPLEKTIEVFYKPISRPRF